MQCDPTYTAKENPRCRIGVPFQGSAPRISPGRTLSLTLPDAEISLLREAPELPRENLLLIVPPPMAPGT